MRTSLFITYAHGSLKLEWESETLTGVFFVPKRKKEEEPKFDFQRAHIQQFKEYFAGKRKTFDLQWKPKGTEFEICVWNETAKIPYGRTLSYGEIARKIGRPKAFRAVGRAMGRNPIPIVVPCHRVLSSAGKLHGFAGGLETKAYLLTLEGALDTATLSPSKKRKGASFHAAA